MLFFNFKKTFVNRSEYSDWLCGLAQLLRPLPFPALLLIRSIFMEYVSSITSLCTPICKLHRVNYCSDKRCPEIQNCTF